MNMKQVYGVIGGFFFAYLIISLTNKPHVTPKDAGNAAGGAYPGQAQPNGMPAPSPAGNAGGAIALSGVVVEGANLDAFEAQALDPALASLGSGGWVALSPTLYVDQADAPRVAADPLRTPTTAALTDAIARCHARGLRVLVRPVLVSRDGAARAQIGPAAGALDGWFRDYTALIEPMIDAAEHAHAEAFSLAAGLPKLNRAPGWSGYVTRAKGRYRGKVTYGASLAEASYKDVPFWGDLDYMGLEGAPSADWASVAADLESYRANQVLSLPVLFTAVEGDAASFQRPIAEKPWFAGASWAASAATGGTAAGATGQPDAGAVNPGTAVNPGDAGAAGNGTMGNPGNPGGAPFSGPGGPSGNEAPSRRRGPSLDGGEPPAGHMPPPGVPGQPVPGGQGN
jgi:hypothetical protein